jgi:ABC-type sugar transport system substrate-binding protein
MNKQYIKNLLGVLLVMMVGLTAASSSDKKIKVGMAVQDLSNPTWAGYQTGGRFQGWKFEFCFL